MLTSSASTDPAMFCPSVSSFGRAGLAVFVITALSCGGSGTEPIPPVVPVPFTALTGGFYHTCGLTSAGAAYCWDANFSGQLGNGATYMRLTPVAGEFSHLWADERGRGVLLGG